MPLYVADYLRDTRRLTTAEHGAYLLLIMEYWTAGELPDDDRQLARIVGMTATEWRKAKPVVQAFFTDGWIHGRINDEIAKATAKHERRSEAGKRGGIASANAKQNPSNAQASSSQPQSQKEDSRADAGASNFTEGSKSLTDALWKALGFASPLEIPPELAGADWRAIGWEDAGWTTDLIDSEARRIGPGKPLTYYEKVFATAFAKRQAPLPVVEIREAEKLTVTNHVRPKSGIIQAVDALCEKLASFDGPSGGLDELRGGAGQVAVRLLPNG